MMDVLCSSLLCCDRRLERREEKGLKMEWDDSFIYLHSHHRKEEQNDKQTNKETKSFCNNIQYTVCKVNVTTHCTVLYCTRTTKDK